MFNISYSIFFFKYVALILYLENKSKSIKSQLAVHSGSFSSEIKN